MDIYKSLEHKSKVLGIPMMECGALVCLLLSLMILGGIAGFFIQVSGWFYLVSLGLILALYATLRRAARKKHPSFLLSWISYHLFQPKRILTYGHWKNKEGSKPRSGDPSAGDRRR